MADELASIIVRITADAQEFLDAMGDATTEAKAFMEVGVALAGVGTLISGSFLAMSESAASFEGKIYDMEQRTGLATDTLSGLTLATEAYGRNIESLSTSMRKLATEAENADNGQKIAVKLFEDLGINVNDANGNVKQLSVLLPEVSDALSKVTNSTELANDATLLFGRGGLALIPIFKQGSQGLQEWSDAAVRAGTDVSQSQADMSKQFQIAQNLMFAALQGTANAIGDVFMPSLMDLAKEASSLISVLNQWAEAHGPLIKVIAEASLVLAGAGGLIAGIGAVAYITPLATAAMIAFAAGFEPAIIAIDQYAGALADAIVLAGNLGTVEETIAAAGVGATAGTIGLAGAIGILTGELVNWLIKGTEVQDWVDQFTDQALRSLHFEWDATGEASKSAAFTMSASTDTMLHLINSLATADAQRAADRAAQEAAFAQMQLQHNADMAELVVWQDTYNEAIDEWNTKVDEQVTSFHDLTDKQYQFIDALKQEIATHGDASAAVATHGGEIIALGKAMDHAKISMDADIATAVLSAVAHNALTDKLQEQIAKGLDYNQSLAQMDIALATNTGAGEEMNFWLAEGGMRFDAIQLGTTSFIKALYILVNKSRDVKDSIGALVFNTKILTEQLQQQNYVLDNQLAAYQGVDKGLIDHNALVKEQISEAQQVSSAMKDQIQLMQDWQQLSDKLASGIADGFAKAIVDGKNFWTSMVSLAQSSAETMLSAFLKGFISPFTDEIQKLGKSISSSLSGAMSGAIGEFGGIGAAMGGALSMGLISIAVPAIEALWKWIAGTSPQDSLNTFADREAAAVAASPYGGIVSGVSQVIDGRTLIGQFSQATAFQLPPSYSYSSSPSSGYYGAYGPGSAQVPASYAAPAQQSQQPVVNVTFTGPVTGLPSDVINTITQNIYAAVRFSGMQVQGNQ